MDTMKKALFVCYGGGHADALIPVMKYLRDNTNIKVDAIGVNLAAEKLRMNGIPCKSLSHYLDIKSVEIGFNLAKKRHNFKSAVSFADSIAYYGFTMSDLIDDIGEQRANEVLRIFDRRTMFPARTMMRILNTEKPDVVITTSMNRFEAATLYAAGCLGIPSVKVEDLIGRINRTYPDKIQVSTYEEKEELIEKGINADSIMLKSELLNSPAMKYCEEIYNVQLKLRPSAFAVFCKYAKDEMVMRGIPEESIYVTGQPAFDKHPFYLENTSREKVFESIGVQNNRKIITFMSQPLAERENVLRCLFSAIKEYSLTDYQFVLKLHPNEDGAIHKLILDEYDLENVTIVKNIDVRELLAVSELIVTVSSTTGLEAAVMGKPLVYINTTNTPDEIPFDKMGIGRRCTNAGQLASEIRGVLSGDNSEFNKIALDYKSDSKAASRVASIIEALAYKKIKPSKKVAIIIQARMGSSRLPGKVMMKYCGKPQIQHVVDRMRNSKLASVVMVATSTSKNNLAMKQYLNSNDIVWYEGSEENVLERYIGAAKSVEAEIIVRVTADNPLTSAICIDKMIESHIQKMADYTIMNSLPVGVTAEVVNLSALETVYRQKNLSKEDLEHVTYYIYNHPDLFTINNMEAPEDLRYPEISFTVDTKADMDKMITIYSNLYNGEYIDVRDAIKLVKDEL